MVMFCVGKGFFIRQRLCPCVNNDSAQ